MVRHIRRLPVHNLDVHSLSVSTVCTKKAAKKLDFVSSCFRLIKRTKSYIKSLVILVIPILACTVALVVKSVKWGMERNGLERLVDEADWTLLTTSSVRISSETVKIVRISTDVKISGLVSCLDTSFLLHQRWVWYVCNERRKYI